jgi:hypothetical protein
MLDCITKVIRLVNPLCDSDVTARGLRPPQPRRKSAIELRSTSDPVVIGAYRVRTGTNAKPSRATKDIKTTSTIASPPAAFVGELP